MPCETGRGAGGGGGFEDWGQAPLLLILTALHISILYLLGNVEKSCAV